MGAAPKLTACGCFLIAFGLLLMAAVGRRPDGHHVGDARRRRARGGSWDYIRPADTEPQHPRGRHPRGVRTNLEPGERP